VAPFGYFYALDFHLRWHAAQFEIQALRESVHPRLGGAVADVAFGLPECRHRRHVDDRAMAAFHHAAQRRVSEPHRCHYMKFVHLPLAMQIGNPEAA